MFLYGLGFLMEGALPWFAPVLLAQVVWGCGDTFITGALEAWIASEEEDKPIDKVFLRGSQMGQIGGVLGVVLGTLLGNINLQMPIILGGSLCLLLGLVAQQVSIPWGLVCTAFLLLPALFLVPVAGKKRD